MLSVSSVSFGNNSVIDREGKFTQKPQTETKAPEMPPDSFGDKKKKHTGLKAFLWTAAALVATAAGLGWAAKTGKLSKVETPQGMLDHAKNFFATVGKKVANGFDTTVDFAKGLFKKAEPVVVNE